jgi:hypothetical protein
MKILNDPCTTGDQLNEPEESMAKHHRPLKTLSLAMATTAALALVSASAAIAAPLQPIDLSSQHASETSDVVNVAVVVRRGGGVGPRGNAYRYRSTTVVRPGGPVVRGGAVAVRPGARWARPGWYRWGPGGAIAAGAAIGFVAAGAAVAYAGAAPAPGMCWYYTDPSRTQGFWDYCP